MSNIPDSIIDRIVYLEGLEKQGLIKNDERIELEQLKTNYPIDIPVSYSSLDTSYATFNTRH